MEYAWFSLTSLVQSELKKVKREWNTHLFIWNSRHDTVSGIPDELYFLLQQVHYKDHGINVYMY